MANRTYSSRGNAVVQQPMPGLVALWRKVGNGGANRADDTQAVQIALNAVPVPLGGPQVPLKADGKVGPKTIAAIRRFQEYWTKVVDGRVDPGGPTVEALNNLAGVPLPHKKTPGPAAASGRATPQSWAPQRVQVAKAGTAGTPVTTSNLDLNRINAAIIRMDLIRHEHLPAMQHVLDRAMPQLQQAMRYAHLLFRPPTGPAANSWNSRDNPDRLCFLVVAKHLHLSEKNAGAALEAIDHVIGLVRVMRATLMERQTATGAMSDADDIYVALYRQPADSSTEGAHTYHGGRWRQTGRRSGRVVVGFDGRPMPERLDRIYVAPLFDGLSREAQRHVLIHELLHYCGELPYSPLRIHDHAYCWQAHYAHMTKHQRKTNTDTLSLLLQDFALGTAMAARAGGVDVKILGTVPWVEFDGLITVPDLVPGQADPVAFPASFPPQATH